MQDKGINSTFKKIIYESSEMVFLADDTYPYSIFYANESFDEQIGETLKDRSLVGLGLDINAYIFKEELVLAHNHKDYSFRLELPQDSGSNYFLFYKGKEIKTHGLPNKKEAYQFFTSKLDLIAIGKYDYLTYLNSMVLPVLGYEPAELLNTNLCSFIHEEDLSDLQAFWKVQSKSQEHAFQTFRFKAKDGTYRYLECSIQFTQDSFFVIARDISNRISTQEDERYFSTLADQIPSLANSASWKFSITTREFSWNQGEEHFFQKFQIKEPHREEVKDQLLNFLGGLDSEVHFKENYQGEIQLSSGKKLGSIVYKPKSNPSSLWGVFWDNSAKELLQKEIQIQKSIWAESPESMMLVDDQGTILSINRESINLFGIKDESKVKHLSDLNIFFEEENVWSDWINSSKGTTIISRFSTLLISENGNSLTLEVAAKRLNLDQKECVLLSFRNITEQITLEKTIEESSDFLMNLTEQVPGGLYQLVLNSEGQMNFSFLSKGINSVLGISQEEIYQFNDISAAIAKVHPQDLPTVIMSSVASAKKMEPWQCQFRVKSGESDQPYRWVLGAARPQSLENGDMVWYGYLTDITKQKEFEVKLDEARVAAEKANQIKSDFLSMISHELRTPLNAISGSVYSLFHENPTDSQKSALNTINFAVDNLIIMINDLLDFQKIEAGKLTIENNPFRLKELLEQIIKGLSFHAADSKNKLTLQLSEGLDITVKGDKTRLSQVLNNLITNALKFTNEGNVDVKVELVGQIRNKVKVYFEVKDTGIGIAPENQEKIFNDFDQVRPTFSTKYGGTGLGLSITRKLLNLMGGKIALESAVGKGSRFFFDLELERSEEDLVYIQESKRKPVSLDKLHLLMAEDNEVNSLVLGKIIKKWGFTYDRVENGQEAVEAVKKGNYDCILMDIQMPVMDGFEATVAIKEFSETPVIALTAAAKLEIMEKIDECGFEGFVAKPIDAAELLKKIKEVITEKNYKA
ncbi:ATP-binding protein [Algoriphagus sp. AK58]|uniref:ATP-binding protein n=1 Tax=Algoriphagus sp. AK58 TaxID=1406877 RepID=UPI0016507016|nr:ATP-binding protein [Algoriphagus sp. AK58]MBC6368591.1 hybrid sensor histidine kinase/response regulator [Algoriphagus sp. AK58]